MTINEILDECANCGRRIGKLETGRVFSNNVVCAECYARLAPSATRARNENQFAKTGVACSSCGGQMAGGGLTCPHCGKLTVLTGREKLSCPKCGWQGINTSFKVVYIILAIIFFPIGLLLLFLPKEATCTKCRHKFEAPGMKIA